jgi:2-(3-amino-3-carboxypropyl)histidine synthase
VKKTPKIVKRLVKKQPWETMLAENPALQKAVSVLPSNYEFEVPKCLYKIKEAQAKLIALQLPEGLLFCACILSDIFRNFANVRVMIMGDVTYGACCIDDFTAEKLGADLLIHYGHSCLVPIQQTRIKTIYVFVEIYFDTSHLATLLQHHFPRHSKLALQGTVQFLRAVAEVAQSCQEHFERIDIPQCKPLSPGETLGCTSAPLKTDIHAAVFIADGRFHMEATMIRNYHLFDVGNDDGDVVRFYRYDPYAKVLSEEMYDTPTMVDVRKRSIDHVRLASPPARVFGLILGTLGRQGSPQILARLAAVLEAQGKVVVKLLMAELAPWKLQLLSAQVDCWVQIACPRLSIDWAAREYEGQQRGEGDGVGADDAAPSGEHVLCGKPVLTPYECLVAVGHVPWQATVHSNSDRSGIHTTNHGSSNSSSNCSSSSNSSGRTGHRSGPESISIDERRRKYAYPMDYYSGENNVWNNYYKEPVAPPSVPTTTTTTSTSSTSSTASTNVPSTQQPIDPQPQSQPRPQSRQEEEPGHAINEVNVGDGI